MTSTSSIYTVRHQRVAPQIRPAGLGGDYSEATVRDLCSSYNPEGCVTPDYIKVYHHRGGDVGNAHRHYGLAKDPEADRDARYGVVGNKDSNLDMCMRPAMYADRMNVIIDEQRERLYKSNIRKPLGRVPEPSFPVKEPMDGFGIASKKSESTKSIMNGYRDVEVLHPAGVQSDRNYDWEAVGVDPTHCRFGQASDRSESASLALKHSGATKLVPKIVKDYKSTVACGVGEVKPYGFDNPEDWDANKRGRISCMNGSSANHFQYEQPTIKELLSTWAEPKESEDSEDDGKMRSQRQLSASRRAMVLPEASTDQLLSTGTVSTVNGRSIITLQRLDDDVRVHQLVHPCHYVTMGVESRYFAGGRDLEDVRSLCNKCNFGLSDAQIDEVFADNAKDGKCGIEQFKNAATAKGYM